MSSHKKISILGSGRVGSDIVIVTLGRARKPGQSRIELVQGNVEKRHATGSVLCTGCDLHHRQ